MQSPDSEADDAGSTRPSFIRRSFLDRSLLQQIVSGLVVTLVVSLVGFGVAKLFGNPTPSPPDPGPIIHSGSNQVLTLTPASGASGERVTAKASGFYGHETVQVYFQGQPMVEGETSAKGAVTEKFTVPEFASKFPGQTFAVSAVGNTSALHAERSFTAEASQ
jgi:hypothetical protein